MSVEISITDQIVEINETSNPVEIGVAAGASVTPVWGGITGTLSNQTDLQNALNAKVPYSGATANVDLGEFELKAGQLELDQTPTGVAGVAVTRWNDSVGTIETTLKGGNVVLKHGRDMFERVVNKTGIQLTRAAYQAVRVSDAQGQRLAVSLAQANNDNNSADTIGLVVETIDNNQEGYIYTVGEIDGVNTTGTLQGETWVDGDVLYLSPTTAGRITNVKPVAPQHLVVIGYVVYAHANNGKIYVKVMNGWELGELHDVDTTGAVNGNVLKYNGTIWTPSGDVGITSLNGLNAVSQTFATGTSGTDFNISSATSTHTFNLPSASATNRGLLTSADWTTFNNKQNALTNPVTGTGVSGQVAYFTGATTQTGSNNLFWDATNSRLGIGTNSPLYRFHTISSDGTIGAFRNSGAALGQLLVGNTAGDLQLRILASGDGFIFSDSGKYLAFGSNGLERIRIFSGGNVSIGSTSDNGLRFQVTGDGYFSGSVGIGTTSGLSSINFRISKDISGGATAYGQIIDGQIQTGVTANGVYSQTTASTAASTTLTNIYYSRLIQGTFGAGSTITNQFGYFVDASLIGGTNNYGFYGNIASGTGRWNLYMNGSAANWINGNTKIGGNTTLGSQKLEVVGNVKFDADGATNGLYWDNTNKRLGIGTNAPLAPLQVLLNGSASSALTGTTIVGQNSSSGSNSYLSLIGAFNAEAGIIFTDESVAYKGRLIYNNLTEYFGFWTDGSERMRLDASGNLGIGTTSPTLYSGFTTLSINNTTNGAVLDLLTNNVRIGSIYTGLLGASVNLYATANVPLIFGTNNTEIARFFANGNFRVGAVAADAGFRLDVNGTMRVSGASTVTSLNINTSGQSRAFNTFYTAGTDGLNIYIGGGGASSTGTGSQGSYNTSLGVSALNANTTGYYNTGVGMSALVANTSGYGNSAIGLFALYSNTTGYNNIAIGTSAGYGTGTNANTTGANNIFIGNQSVGVSSTENNRTWIGNTGTTSTWLGGRLLLGSTTDDGVNRLQVTGAATFSSSVTAASYTINDAGNITIGTTTGTKIGTATSQKIGFWNATPIVQPTTAVAAAAFVANTGTAVNDASTFDGYTMAQIVKALRNAGLLA